MKNTAMHTNVKNVNYSGNKVTEDCKLKRMILIPVLGGRTFHLQLLSLMLPVGFS